MSNLQPMHPVNGTAFGRLIRQWRGMRKLSQLERPLPPVLPVELAAGEVRLRLFTMISTFGTPQDVTTDEVRVESLFPADDTTAEVLRMLAGTEPGAAVSPMSPVAD